jgi:hypothetical protein
VVTSLAPFRISEVPTSLNVSWQRMPQMRLEGKLPEPDRIDRIGPLWKPVAIE